MRLKMEVAMEMEMRIELKDMVRGEREREMIQWSSCLSLLSYHKFMEDQQYQLSPKSQSLEWCSAQYWMNQRIPTHTRTQGSFRGKDPCQVYYPLNRQSRNYPIVFWENSTFQNLRIFVKTWLDIKRSMESKNNLQEKQEAGDGHHITPSFPGS